MLGVARPLGKRPSTFSPESWDTRVLFAKLIGAITLVSLQHSRSGRILGQSRWGSVAVEMGQYHRLCGDERLSKQIAEIDPMVDRFSTRSKAGTDCISQEAFLNTSKWQECFNDH
jgi:hypothetical protein